MAGGPASRTETAPGRSLDGERPHGEGCRWAARERLAGDVTFGPAAAPAIASATAATLDGCTAARPPRAPSRQSAEQVPPGRVGLCERAGKPVGGANVRFREARLPPCSRERRSPGTKRWSRRKARRSRGGAEPSAPLGKSASTSSRLAITRPRRSPGSESAGSGGRRQSPQSAFAAHLAGVGRWRKQPQRHDAVRVGDAVRGDLGAPVAETVVGNPVGQRIEERFVQQAARCAAARGVEDRRGGAGSERERGATGMTDRERRSRTLTDRRRCGDRQADPRGLSRRAPVPVPAAGSCRCGPPSPSLRSPAGDSPPRHPFARDRPPKRRRGTTRVTLSPRANFHSPGRDGPGPWPRARSARALHPPPCARRTGSRRKDDPPRAAASVLSRTGP